MDYCDGGTLASLCAEVFLSEPEIAHFTRQVLEGLHYLHTHRCCHRDMKVAFP